jgi:hypothetical protein
MKRRTIPKIRGSPRLGYGKPRGAVAVAVVVVGLRVVAEGGASEPSLVPLEELVQGLPVVLFVTQPTLAGGCHPGRGVATDQSLASGYFYVPQ